MCLSRNIILNNSLLLDCLILGFYSYCDSQIHDCSSSTYYSEINSLRSILLKDFIFLNSRSPNNIKYSIKYKNSKQINFTRINVE